VEIKHTVKIEWVGNERFLGRKEIVKKNLSCCSLNKKQMFELKTEEIRIKQSFEIFSNIGILRFGLKNSKFKGENII
jgi:hypothetical protein